MEVGFFGKLPTHGDFLRRRIADGFVAAWDAWLQRVLADSRTVLGDRWLDTYLTSPLWRFALAAGLCGESPVAGVLAPSVDRVGRYFPLTVAWATPPDCCGLEVATRFEAVFERAERLLVESLAQEDLQFADFDRRVAELAEEPAVAAAEAALRLRSESVSRLLAHPGRPWRVPLRAAAALQGPATQLLGSHWQQSRGAGALWWTDGSALVEPSWLITPALPEGQHYTAMLDGRWAAADWDVALAEAAAEAPSPAASAAPTAAFFDSAAIQSAARSEVGPVRSSNQDAFLERGDAGLWVVADGMGGLSQGDVASRMVCDSLVEVRIVAGLEEQIELVVEQLRAVNAYLWRGANRPNQPVRSGSTVVVLVLREHRCAILWAGDSRAYRLRDGTLAQLSSDHSWLAEGLDDPEDLTDAGAQAITRAVGVEEQLQLDVVRCDLRPHDRYLLCSDGIVRVLDDVVLQRLLGVPEIAGCCTGLIAAALAGGATDNVTAVVVDFAAPAADPAGEGSA